MVIGGMGWKLDSPQQLEREVAGRPPLIGRVRANALIRRPSVGLRPLRGLRQGRASRPDPESLEAEICERLYGERRGVDRLVGRPPRRRRN